MIIEEDKRRMEKEILKMVDELSLDLVEFTMKMRGRTVFINVLADRLTGGITVDECSRLNKRINRYIEEQGLYGDDFAVEVSSPGLDRPLTTVRDFLRVQGKPVVFYLQEPFLGKKEYSGEILRVNKNIVTIKVKDEEKSIPFEKINKAVQILLG